MRNRLFTALLAGALLAVAAASVPAQSFPSKPIRIIVAVTPGGVKQRAGDVRGLISSAAGIDGLRADAIETRGRAGLSPALVEMILLTAVRE